MFSLFERGLQFDVASDVALRGMVESISFDEGVDRKRRLLDLLDEAHKFSVPKGMVDRELSSIWRQLKAEHRLGIFDDDDVGKSDAELRAEYRSIAERRVRLGLVLGAIAKRNSIAVSHQEAVDARAEGYRGPKSVLLEEKIFEFLFGLARRA